MTGEFFPTQGTALLNSLDILRYPDTVRRYIGKPTVLSSLSSERETTKDDRNNQSFICILLHALHCSIRLTSDNILIQRGDILVSCLLFIVSVCIPRSSLSSLSPVSFSLLLLLLGPVFHCFFPSSLSFFPHSWIRLLFSF